MSITKEKQTQIERRNWWLLVGRGREMSRCEKEIRDVINKIKMMQRYNVQPREHSLHFIIGANGA